PTKITITKQPTKTITNIDNQKKQTKVTTAKVVEQITPASDKPIDTKDDKSLQISSETKESDQIIIIEEIDESEEALIAEWLIGTGLTFKQ
ncbi:687_t:CDS:2, partial [Dentiscutata heterogama]